MGWDFYCAEGRIALNVEYISATAPNTVAKLLQTPTQLKKRVGVFYCADINLLRVIRRGITSNVE